MNKIQRRKSKEIKKYMKTDKFGRITYAQAKRKVNYMKKLQ